MFSGKAYSPSTSIDWNTTRHEKIFQDVTLSRMLSPSLDQAVESRKVPNVNNENRKGEQAQDMSMIVQRVYAIAALIPASSGFPCLEAACVTSSS